MNKGAIFIIAVTVLFLSAPTMVFAQKREAVNGKKILRRSEGEIAGTISGISKNYISVLYKQDQEKGAEYEVLLPITSDVQFEHRKSLKDFAIGDEVGVVYEDLSTEDANKEQKMERRVKVISFVKRGAKRRDQSKPSEEGAQ